jgi:hypothetical protein
MKDRKSVKENGKCVCKQKHLLTMNLAEAHSEFMLAHPSMQVRISKFAALRPKEVVLVSGKDQCVCCCPYCENLCLLLEGNASRLKPHPHSLKCFIGDIVCDIDNVDCMYGVCPNCSEDGLAIVEAYVDLNGDPQECAMVYEWNKGYLVQRRFGPQEYLERLLTYTTGIKSHHYTMRHQKGVMRTQIDSLEPGHCVLQTDFAENFQISQ